jgi:hypothetical protein
MTDKRRGNAPPEPAAGDNAGRLGVDDRGNVTWEWNEDQPDLVADDDLGASRRMRALVDPRLEVKDDDSDPLHPVHSNPKGLKSGYNPYNSGALGKESYRKARNLKELSKWIELRRKMSQTSDRDGD